MTEQKGRVFRSALERLCISIFIDTVMINARAVEIFPNAFAAMNLYTTYLYNPKILTSLCTHHPPTPLQSLA
jgi:hypothetical protein